jgi:predicted RNA-binding Zn-ribbon protein involved in translation (DUF1610 family)
MKVVCHMCGEMMWRLDTNSEPPRFYCDMCGNTMPREVLLKMLGLEDEN